MSENNIKPTSSSSTAQVSDQLQSKTSKPLDGASCSAARIDLIETAKILKTQFDEMRGHFDQCINHGEPNDESWQKGEVVRAKMLKYLEESRLRLKESQSKSD